MTALPASLSLFRGQGRRGIGEGPGQPIAHGDQYLDAAAELQDVALLRAFRPWMTLDTDPRDRQVLGDRLEGWSCFEEGGWLGVVRLGAAEKYDTRGAYFSHGRAWRLEDLGPGIDPGLLLGHQAAFDSAWTGLDPTTRSDSIQATELLASHGRAVARAPVMAARLLAALLQARLERVPVCVAVPVLELAAGTDLARLVSFARAALPYELRRGCRLRIYTRLVRRYLGELDADLVAVPEVLASEAFRARSDVLLLDGEGSPQGRSELPKEVLRFADELVERTLEAPDLLPAFAVRFQEFRQRPSIPPMRADLPWAGRVHALAQILHPSRDADPKAQIGLELWQLAASGGPEGEGAVEDWQRLLSPKDWSRVPPRDHMPLLFADPSSLSSRHRALQRAAEEAAVRLDRTGDRFLEAWWEPRQLPRLAALLDRTPPLVSPAAVARRTAGLPLSALEGTGHAAALLQAERHAGVLAHRREGEVLARLARDPECRRVLLVATGEGDLEADWLDPWLDALEEGELRREATTLLGSDTGLERWPRVLAALLERLRGLGDGARVLVPALEGLADRLARSAPMAQVSIPLADLLRRWAGPERPFLVRLRDQLEGLSGSSQRVLLDLLSPATGTASDLAAILLVRDGCPVGAWIYDHSAALLAIEAVRRVLESAVLLDLAGRLPDERMDLGLRVIEEIVRRFREEPVATTAVLVRTGWWFFWHRSAELTDEEARAASLDWLTSSAWYERDGPRPSLEAWSRAVESLRQPPLAETAMERLCLRGALPEVRWPRIPDFEDRQVEDLVAAAGTLGSLALLAQALRRHPFWTEWGEPELLLAAASPPLEPPLSLTVASSLVRDLLALTEGREPGGGEGLDRLRPLATIEGQLRPLARELLARSLLRELERQPTAALDLWREAVLWSDHDAEERLRRWILSLREPLPEALRAALEREVPTLTTTDVPVAAARASAMARELEARSPRLAAFLAPGAVEASLPSTAQRLLGLVREGKVYDLEKLLGPLACPFPGASPRSIETVDRSGVGRHAAAPTLGALLAELRTWRPVPTPEQLPLCQFVRVLPAPFKRPMSGGLVGFQLAGLLYTDHTLGELARCFALDGAPFADSARLEWWIALLREVTLADRPWGAGVGDRPEVARALLHRMHHDLEPAHRDALLDALDRTASTSRHSTSLLRPPRRPQ